ncbi:hypothetical protein CPB84DRAFT_1782123 [Gymnopilus junonius]|uniref:Uncharacterized protein n=1 Tax=Gymnopilus junonius TaxID=109634 RepID=A0A9P5NLM1_GYMJU|nr:hypothetical protein CPB84DRAFT_1782123 [Gymnopilus junonius]
MSDFKISIPRPVVKVQGKRRRRVSFKENLHATLGPTSYLLGHERRINKMLFSCRNSKNLIFMSTVFLICATLLPMIWFCQCLQNFSTFIHQRLPYPSLATTVLETLTFVSLITFPISTSFILLLLCIALRGSETALTEIGSLTIYSVYELHQIDAYLSVKLSSCRATFQDTIASLVDHLEGRWQKELRIPIQRQSNEIDSLPSDMVGSSINKESRIRTKWRFDTELGRRARDTTFESNEKPHTATPSESPEDYYLSSTILDREANLQVLRGLRPSIKVELARLRTIPGFDADSWVLVNHPWIDGNVARGRPTQVSRGRKRRVAKSI